MNMTGVTSHSVLGSGFRGLDPRGLKTALFCISVLRKGEVLAYVGCIHNLKDLKGGHLDVAVLPETRRLRIVPVARAVVPAPGGVKFGGAAATALPSATALPTALQGYLAHKKMPPSRNLQ